MEKAVVTGATGLVGSTLCRTLQSMDVEVHALGRDVERLRELEDEGMIIHRVDITGNSSEIKSGLPDEAVWFHCAAAISGADRQTLYRVNVEGTRNVLTSMRDLHASYLVHVSSIATYTITLGRPLKEDSPQSPFSNYGKSKLRAEKLVRDSGIPHTIIRPPFIGGPGDRNFLEEITSRLERGRLPLITRNGRIGYVDVRDLVKVMALCPDDKRFENMSLNVQGTDIGFHEFVSLLAGVAGLPEPRWKFPYPVAYAVGLAAELFNGLRGRSSERGLSRYRVKTLAAVRTLDCTRLHSLIDFQPIPIERSIEDWLKTRNKE